jgi:drug/metabolite transporter (DMT)-like permease
MMYLGETAALATALLWAFTSIFFAEAGKRIGSHMVNVTRLGFAVILYATVLFVTTGRPWPVDPTGTQIFWLGMSGLVGLVFGDGCGFKALVMIGPRLTTLFYATAPIMATGIAWLFLGEALRWIDLVGVALTVGGVMWVVSERQFSQSERLLAEDHPDRGSLLVGSLLGLGAALGQAAGLVMAKHAMTHGGPSLDPLHAAFVRMVIALVAIYALTAARGKLGKLRQAFKDARGMQFSLYGAIVGPFLAVWLSLVAVKLIPTGIAATLNATTPIMIIPIVVYYNKETVSLRGVLGAIVAVCGVGLLFLG